MAVKIHKKQTNARNAHLIEMGLVEQKDNRKMSKISNKQLRTMLDAGIIDTDGYNKAIESNLASDKSRNKLNLLRDMEGFSEIEEQLNTWVALHREEIEKIFDKYNETFSKCSINVNK